jgi:hypothetical protein
MTDHTSTGTYQFEFPQDLLHVSRQAPKPTPERLRVEGWRTSWLSRLSELLIGKDKSAS